MNYNSLDCLNFSFEMETDKAFKILLHQSTYALKQDAEVWVPKSVCRGVETEDGQFIFVQSWYYRKEILPCAVGNFHKYSESHSIERIEKTLGKKLEVIE